MTLVKKAFNNVIEAFIRGIVETTWLLSPKIEISQYKFNKFFSGWYITTSRKGQIHRSRQSYRL